MNIGAGRALQNVHATEAGARLWWFSDRQHRSEQKQAGEFLRLDARKLFGAAADWLRLSFNTADAHPVDAILRAARKHRADLVVMGTHGRGGAQRLWLGSVTENIVRQAEMPVFVARQNQHEFINSSDPTSMPGLKTILCPVNLTDTARAALQHAASLAQQFQARLVTPCIVEPSAPQGVAASRQELAAWLAEFGVGKCEIEPLARKGQAAEQIVALGRHHRDGPGGAQLR